MVEVLLLSSVVVTVLASILSTLKVVITRRAIAVSTRFPTVGNNFLHPTLFRVESAVQAMNLILSNKIDAFSYMFALAIQHVRQIESEERLVAAHYEEVGVPMRMYSKQGTNSVRVLDVEVLATFANDLVINPCLLYFEPSRVYQYV